ncbi:MAG TPA: hypothetical protein VFN57_16280 [Thermomicrobiaceae bacterium]|nr:hypothetical protein [Thermomicrobiaceae bacterium]
MTATDATASTVSRAGTTQALGIDIIRGFSGMSSVRQLDAVLADRGAIWSRALLLGDFSNRLPVAHLRLGIMLLSGWTSLEERAAFREGPGYRKLTNGGDVSLDLGAGMVRSTYENVTLNPDGWDALLPVGKSPRGTVAVLTYTRVRPRSIWAFQRLAHAVAISAAESEGCIGSAFGTMPAAPLMRVMSLTLWNRRAHASQWAYNGDTHPEAIAWLLEAPRRMPGGFVARFPIVAAAGVLHGIDLAAALERADGGSAA